MRIDNISDDFAPAGSRLKKLVGLGLFNICNSFPAAKPYLRRWGLRTQQEWFPDAIVRVQMPGGKSFQLASLPHNYLSFELFWRGTVYYEPVTTLVACELARSANTFIDVGANIGFYSLVLSTYKPGLRVVSFEPNPKNFQLLHANVQLNQFSNVTCEPLALSDMSGTGALFLSASDMSASLERDFEASRGPVLKVSTATLDGYLAQRPVSGPVLIKVDVEGHEAAFFKGARQTISSLKPDIISEVTLRPDSVPLPFLRELGYRFYQITDQGLLPTNELAMVIRGRFRFLNCLLSARPATEIAELFKSIEPQVRRIDLTQTSKLVPAEVLQRFQDSAPRPPEQSPAESLEPVS
ncbi:MAG TPA: FkbM family methyltransferase [Verrucomicrobiae bacterium]|nr:FkbM family methyltransferase [Verrucomicrobiae bacterium]